MCFFVAVALRPGMLMLLPDLITLRIVMILTKVESIYTSFRLQDERVIQHPGGRIVTSLCKQRPPARRVDVDAELKRRGVFLVVSCSWSSRSSIVACCWRCPRSESVERANAASSLSRTRSPSSTEPRAAMTRRRVSASYCAIATVESSSTSLFTLIPRCRAISFSRPWVSSGMRMVSVDMSLFLYSTTSWIDGKPFGGRLRRRSGGRCPGGRATRWRSGQARRGGGGRRGSGRTTRRRPHARVRGCSG